MVYVKPYFLRDPFWYEYNNGQYDDGRTFVLTEAAPPEARRSYEEFYNPKRFEMCPIDRMHMKTRSRSQAEKPYLDDEEVLRRMRKFFSQFDPKDLEPFGLTPDTFRSRSPWDD